MAVGVAAALAAPREAQHAIREIHVEGLPRVPWRDSRRVGRRLVLLAGAALILGSGLSANASLLGESRGGRRPGRRG